MLGKKIGRRKGRNEAKKIELVMREFKKGELKSGRSGKPVKSRKQAIAIALSEARRAVASVPRQAKGSQPKGSR